MGKVLCIRSSASISPARKSRYDYECRNPYRKARGSSDDSSRYNRCYSGSCNPYRKARGSSDDSGHYKHCYSGSHHCSGKSSRRIPTGHSSRYRRSYSMRDRRKRSLSSEGKGCKYSYAKSGKYIREGKIRKALKAIQMAVSECPDNDKFLSDIYSRRGVIYTLKDKPRCSLQGFLDFERAYQINKENIEARRNMSKVFFKSANRMNATKKYDKALELCHHALSLDSQNGEASVLFTVLKKKLSTKKKDKESVVALDSMTKRNPQKVELIEKEIEKENLPRALLYVKQALNLYRKDFPVDAAYHMLVALKQSLMEHMQRFSFEA